MAFAVGLAAECRAQASAATGIIAGEVLNQATAQYLPGALVQIAGTTSQTTTDRSGAFSLAAAAGPQTLEISFTGLDTARLPVMVEAGKTVRQTIELTSAVYKLEPVTVAGIREGNALAIQAQRLADNVKTVISTDAFGTPAVNPGELLQRLTGVNVDLLGGEAVSYRIRGLDSTWTNLMVDGNSMATSMGTSPASRLVNIQQIGTNNIESIELIKAPTPDMDANAIGGYVNMITKRAFDRAPGQDIRLSLGTRWTRLKGGDVAKDKPGLDQLGFSFSNVYSVFGKQNNLGILLNASQRISPAVTDEAGPANSFVGAQTTYMLPTAQNGLATPLMRAFGTGSLFWPDQRNRTIGLNIDYKLSPNSYVYLKNAFNTTRIPGNGSGAGYVRMVTSVPAAVANFVPGSTYQLQEVLPVAASTTELLIGHQKRKTDSYSVSGGFERKFPESGGTLNFDASYSLADVSYPVISLIRMSARGIGWRLDRSGGGDSFEPAFTQTAGPSIYDPASYTPNAATNFKQIYTAPKENMALRLDYKKNFALKVPAYVKAGLKYSNNHLEQTNRVSYTGYIGPAGIPAKYIAPLFTQGGGNYGPYPYLTAPFSGLSGDIMQDQSLWAARGIDAYNSALYSDQGRALDGEMDESIQAAYLMGSVTVAKLRIVPGLRLERTEVSATGYPRNQTASWGGNFDATLSDAANAARALHAILPAQTHEKSYQNVFPGIHFIYEPLDRLLVRASYNTSIVRPPVASLMPTVVINPELRTLTAPNLELKPYTSDNFEFAVQKYFEPVGSFEIGVFLKEIKNYIRSIPVVIGSGPNNGFGGEYEGYTWNMAQNTGNARIRGFEINYQQQYSFLPGLWRGLGSFANFTYTDAQGDFGTTLFQKRIAYQRPRTANAGVSYRGKGFEVRLLGNWQGSYYIMGAGATSIYSDPQLMIDMKSTYSINRTYQLYFDIMNLTNENVSTMVQEGGMKIYAQKQGVIFSAGLNQRF